MVFFTCNECGQSVKKNQVESHCFQCRSCQSLSCMDCNKVFWGNEYKEHVKCITEDQRYGGKDYVAKPSSNKGEVKQEKWIEFIKSTIAEQKISGFLSTLLGQMISYTNIPRKKSKFVNFLKNSMKVRNDNLIEQAWDIFAEGTKSETPDSSANQSINGEKAENGISSTNGIGAKRSADSNLSSSAKKNCLEPNSKEAAKESSFDWCGACERILQSFPEGLSEKKLRKKVFEEYKTTLNGSNCHSNAELKTIFRSKITNDPTFSLSVDKSKLSKT